MKHILRNLIGSAAAAGLAIALIPAPVSAQEKVVAPSGGGAEKASAPSSAPSAPSGGSTGSSGSSGSTGGYPGGSFGTSVYKGSGDSGRRSGATGGSGYTAPRSPRAVDDGNRGAGTSTGSAERGRRAGDNGRAANTPGSGTNGNGVPTYSRPRDGNEPVGTAVPRGTTPRPDGPSTIFVPGGYYYPGYYGYPGYYDPYGAYGYGFYGSGYYDPWYGGYPVDVQGGTTYTSNDDEGSLRLKIKPREAEVYVDGYYVGLVDEFDGMFQRLHLDSGPHRIEVRAPGFETLDFEVRITPEHTTTYQGELKKIQ